MCTVGVILLEDIHFRSPVAILCLFLLGTVLAEIIGFDVSGMETIICQNRRLHGVGEPVLLGSSYWLYSCSLAQHCSL